MGNVSLGWVGLRWSIVAARLAKFFEFVPRQEKPARNPWHSAKHTGAGLLGCGNLGAFTIRTKLLIAVVFAPSSSEDDFGPVERVEWRAKMIWSKPTDCMSNRHNSCSTNLVSCFALAFPRLHKTFITDRGRPYTDTPFVMPPGALKSSTDSGRILLCMALTLTYDFVRYTHIRSYKYIIVIYCYQLL